MASVALAVADGMSLFEVAAAIEVFGVDRTDLADPWYDFALCGRDDARIGGWFRAEGLNDLDRLVAADTVIVPGWRDLEQEPPAELVTAVRAAHARGARVVSVCTGAFVLAEAGLLDGRRATTHWRHAGVLAARYPRVQVDPDVLYVDDGDILTSAGKTAGMDLCLHVVRLDHGAAVANALARRLVTPPHRPGGQAQFVPAPVPATDDQGLAGLMRWAIDNIEQPITISDMARRVHTSSRNLARQFNAAIGSPPLQWLLAQRIQRAEELLETTDHSIEHVAARTGMGTATTLRRHFQRAVGVPPDTYRRTFRAGPASAALR